MKLSDEERAIQTKVRSLSAKATDEERAAIEDKVRTLEKETTAIKRQQAMWDQLVKDANTVYDLRKSNAELIKFGDVQGGFNDALAKTREQFDQGLITEDQFKAEADKLGKAYNDYFIDPAKSGTNNLSEFSIQAARNMQSAFADFLFDPFSNGLDGMAVNFAKIIQRMVAEAQIFETLLGKNYGQSNATNGLLGALFSGIAGAVGGAFGGESVSVANGNSEAFSSAMSDPNFWGSMSAKGNAFDHGRLLAFANGGVVSRPTTFPMANGKTGLMGEAGEEAIMPLKRNANGQLGVIVSGGQGVDITTNVNVTGNGGGNSDSGDMGGKLGTLVNSAVRQVIVTELRPGGLLAAK